VLAPLELLCSYIKSEDKGSGGSYHLARIALSPCGIDGIYINFLMVTYELRYIGLCITRLKRVQGETGFAEGVHTTAEGLVRKTLHFTKILIGAVLHFWSHSSRSEWDPPVYTRTLQQVEGCLSLQVCRI
jgi:hypothetical protein